MVVWLAHVAQAHVGCVGRLAVGHLGAVALHGDRVQQAHLEAGCRNKSHPSNGHATAQTSTACWVPQLCPHCSSPPTPYTLLPQPALTATQLVPSSLKPTSQAVQLHVLLV